jgi:hypothetical protein
MGHAQLNGIHLKCQVLQALCCADCWRMLKDPSALPSCSHRQVDSGTQKAMCKTGLDIAAESQARSLSVPASRNLLAMPKQHATNCILLVQRRMLAMPRQA